MGRPALKIGEHGKINREQLEPNKWVAHCYYKGLDGKRKQAERSTPVGMKDRHGLAAEAALEAHLKELLSGGVGSTDDGAVTGGTLVSALLERHLQALRKAGKSRGTLRSYGYRIGYWNDVAGGITVGDCTAGRIERHLVQVEAAHGYTDAKQLRTLLGYALDYAVRDNVVTYNPARSTKPLPKPPSEPKNAAQPLDPAVLPEVMKALLSSESCAKKDLTDPILMHLATGLRVSEVLGFLWTDFDSESKTITPTGRIVWDKGVGVLRVPITRNSHKGTAEVIDLPDYAVDMLLARAQEERPNQLGLVFPSSVGTMRDPSNFASQWRGVRDDLEHLAGTTGHTFRKTLSDLTADKGNPRMAADVLGHKDVSTTLRHYLSKGRRHPEVAKWNQEAVTGKPAKGTRKPRQPKKSA
ncbi:tyrosine-type recombinase/integrase [Mycolicibacter arupensis]|uniref:Site-specific integrase n=1 Tax=Mycolicibacter arupensis TaxID=342002 RepID=A0A5C7Y1Z6_9MYCO|nr:tyrosine-type recombinase/integrase [Mycolicibacter arupensis]TXI55905.1 MAG: site-specific integrase [Mycolicibacter arupensis]